MLNNSMISEFNGRCKNYREDCYNDNKDANNNKHRSKSYFSYLFGTSHKTKGKGKELKMKETRDYETGDFKDYKQSKGERYSTEKIKKKSKKVQTNQEQHLLVGTNKNTHDQTFAQNFPHTPPPCLDVPPPPLILINGKVWEGCHDNDCISKAMTRETYINLLIAETEQLLEETLHWQCMAGGKGLREGYVGESCIFYVETLESLEDYLNRRKVGVEVIGPENGPIRFTCYPLDENLYEISYIPYRSGRHVVNITWEGSHVIGSPFCANVIEK